MADEYNKRSDALKAIHDEWDGCYNFDGSGSEIAYITESAFDIIQSVNVRPNVHSRWEDVAVECVEDMENPPNVVASMFCPNCKRWHNEVYFYGIPTEEVHFCPFCGAMMDGDNDN